MRQAPFGHSVQTKLFLALGDFQQFAGEPHCIFTVFQLEDEKRQWSVATVPRKRRKTGLAFLAFCGGVSEAPILPGALTNRPPRKCGVVLFVHQLVNPTTHRQLAVTCSPFSDVGSGQRHMLRSIVQREGI